MNNKILKRRRTLGAFSSREHERPPLLKGVDFAILVGHYNAVTPFGKKIK